MIHTKETLKKSYVTMATNTAYIKQVKSRKH